jgi:hypothetical protein
MPDFEMKWGFVSAGFCNVPAAKTERVIGEFLQFSADSFVFYRTNFACLVGMGTPGGGIRQ